MHNRDARPHSQTPHLSFFLGGSAAALSSHPAAIFGAVFNHLVRRCCLLQVNELENPVI
jgi:hypothetical protein